MARSRCSQLLGVTSLLLGATVAQSSTTTTPTNTGSSASSITSSPSVATSSDTPLSLWSDANSLLSSYYPSTSLTNLASVTWPASVVIGSSTYSVHQATTTGSSPDSQASQTSVSDKTNGPPGMFHDRKVGIIIGVIVGLIAFAIMGTIFFLLWRRKRATGTFFKRRATPSISDSEIGAWREPDPSTLTYPGPSYGAGSRYSRLHNDQTAPPMSMHPAYAPHYDSSRSHHDSSRSTSDENPFYTPDEHSQAQLGHHHELPTSQMQHGELDAIEPSQRRTSNSMRESPRPPTPMMHTAMMGLQSPPRNENPFSSPADDEADDLVSPILPTRSPERRYSPMVHYPSWDEVSEFDFAGDGRARRSFRDTSSSEGSGDGFRAAPRRESVIGRQELA